MSLIATLQNIVFRLNLLSPQCFDTLFVKMMFNSPDCWKMFISRGLGLGIIGECKIKYNTLNSFYNSYFFPHFSAHLKVVASDFRWTSIFGLTCESTPGTGPTSALSTDAIRSSHSQQTSNLTFSHTPNKSKLKIG